MDECAEKDDASSLESNRPSVQSQRKYRDFELQRKKNLLTSRNPRFFFGKLFISLPQVIQSDRNMSSLLTDHRTNSLVADGSSIP